MKFRPGQYVCTIPELKDPRFPDRIATGIGVVTEVERSYFGHEVVTATWETDKGLRNIMFDAKWLLLV